MRNSEKENKCNCKAVTLTSISSLSELQNQLGLNGATRLQVNFKPTKVTASCRYNGRSFGVRGTNFIEALQLLIHKIQCPLPVYN